MNQAATTPRLSPVPLLQGDSTVCDDWLRTDTLVRAGVCLTIICVGCGLYGFSIGVWRAAEMALYVAIKFPLLILLTLVVNGLINGLLAQVMGVRLSIAQTVQCQLISYLIFALVLGSLSPVVFAMSVNAPDAIYDVDSDEDYLRAAAAHRTLLLTHVVIIAWAGILSTTRLYRTLRDVTGSRSLALRTLFSWLGGNLFVGAQLAWILRPFFGSPHLSIAFLRPDALDGNFYQRIYRMLELSLGL